MESHSPNSNYEIIIKDKKGCYTLNPFQSTSSKQFTLPECTTIIPGKKYIAILNNGSLSLYNTKDLSLLKTFSNLEQVKAVDFSPKEKYLSLIQKPPIPDNLKVIDLETFETAFRFTSQTNPTTQWPQLTFDKNEELIFRHVKTTIDIYKINPETKEQTEYGHVENAIAFEIAQYTTSKNEHLNALLIGKVVNLSAKSKKCYFSMYNLDNLAKPLKEMDIALTDNMKIKLSGDNKHILVLSTNNNTSNQSYYGNSTLYYTDIESLKFTKFALPEGPIHDFSWCPNGETFIVCAGHLPSKTALYDKTGKKLSDICTGKFNRAFISPDSRLVALGGFGSLGGDIEIYDISNSKQCKLIGKSNIFCCVDFYWSYDSKFILGSVLSKRVKVDNEYRILKYNGEEVIVDKNVGEIYECMWVYKPDFTYEQFNIEVNSKSLEKKISDNKGGIKLTSTLGTIDFSSSSKTSAPSGGIIGLGPTKKRKKKKGGQGGQGQG